MKNKAIYIIGFILIIPIILYLITNPTFNKMNQPPTEILYIIKDSVPPHVVQTQNEEIINEITTILSSLKWSAYNLGFNRNDRKADYYFWMEKRNGEGRIVNCEVWFGNSGSVIFDNNTGNYSFFDNGVGESLENILNDLTRQNKLQ